MFSLGLVVYLYTAIDTTIATIVALTTGATAFFYVITNVLGTLYEVSPFGTQISHSTRRILRLVSIRWQYMERYKHYFIINQPKSSGQTTEQDLHALRWLANHSQDPLVGDSAYHALSGLRSGVPVPHESNVSSVSTCPTFGSNPDALKCAGPPKTLSTQPETLANSRRKDKLITSMFVDVCQRLGEARNANSHELEVSCGASIARFAATLPRLVNYLLSHPSRDILVGLADTRRRQLDLGHEVRTRKTPL